MVTRVSCSTQPRERSVVAAFICSDLKGAFMQLTDTILVFSHLRWDSVYQRPQHLMSRFAAHQRVIFIEEPWVDDTNVPRWETYQGAKNLLVARLRTPNPTPGFHDSHLPELIPMLHRLLDQEQVGAYTVWMYTPQALPAAQALAPGLVVYDCMDELAAFKHAPRELIDRETALLKWADLVFTGGPSLYRAKRDRHPRVSCFPSSVDSAHFRAAVSGPEAQDQHDLPHPRLGFYGVIDERMDLGLLDALASARPDWQIVMVGPVVKIDPASLPRHPNLHYIGQRSYAELPSYLAGWDVCLLPFARNESTKFISPTKTLEYMAAEGLIVSTPITDVAEPYGEIVYLGSTPAEFIAACDRALNASAAERAERFSRMRAVLARTSWDSTAEAMRRLMAAANNKRTLTPTMPRYAAHSSASLWD